MRSLNENYLKVLESSDSVRLYCLGVKANYVKAYDNAMLTEAGEKVQHTNYVVLLLEYANRKLLMTGDSDWKEWKEYIESNYGHYESVSYHDIDILIASHHGSRTFFTTQANEDIDPKEFPDEPFIDHLINMRPKITLISCGDYETGAGKVLY